MSHIPTACCDPVVRRCLCSTGILRAAINLSNVLLVTDKDAQGNPVGVAPDFAKVIAERIFANNGSPKLNNPDAIQNISAEQKNSTLKLVPFPHPNLICDDAEKWHHHADTKLSSHSDIDSSETENCAWDIGLIGADPLRSGFLAFTKPYCEIQACLMVRDSSIQQLKQLDCLNKRIVVKRGGAYHLWLKANLQFADDILVEAETLDQSFAMFCENKEIDALAGLRSKQQDDLAKYMKSLSAGTSSNQEKFYILEENFMSVKQAIGIRRALVSQETEDTTAGAEETGAVNEIPAIAWLNSVIDASLADGTIQRLIDKHGVTGKLHPAKR